MTHVDPSWCARINAHKPAPPPRVQLPAQHLCDLCGVQTYGHSCKIVCPNCGYKRDCTDP